MRLPAAWPECYFDLTRAFGECKLCHILYRTFRYDEMPIEWRDIDTLLNRHTDDMLVPTKQMEPLPMISSMFNEHISFFRRTQGEYPRTYKLLMVGDSFNAYYPFRHCFYSTRVNSLGVLCVHIWIIFWGHLTCFNNCNHLTYYNHDNSCKLQRIITRKKRKKWKEQSVSDYTWVTRTQRHESPPDIESLNVHRL